MMFRILFIFISIFVYSSFQEKSEGDATGHQDLTSFNSAAEIAKQKCAEYAKHVIKDGSKDIDICQRNAEVGQISNLKHYPYMVLIGYGETKPQWSCGGSLISEQFVLGPAHCSFVSHVGTALWIKLGDLNSSNDDTNTKIIKIIERFDHPEYNGQSFYNDLTLFKLEQEVEIGPNIRPICLPTSQDILQDEAIETVWRPVSSGDEGVPKGFIARKLRLVNISRCNEVYNNLGKKLHQGILSSQICAEKQNDKESCQGDTGGPLQISVNDPYCTHQVIGVGSFAKRCSLDVFTRVSHYLPWIVSNVWPDIYTLN